MSDRPSSNLPEIACTLSEEQQAERRKELRSGIMQRVRRVRELSDGYEFGLDANGANEACVDDFVAFESECCGFASYRVRRDEALSAIWLSVRGPGGTKAFVRQLAPESITIEPASTGGSKEKRLLRGGIAGLGTALIAIVCCTTPLLAIALGSIGLGTAVVSAGEWLDRAIVPVVLASLLAIGLALRRRRTARVVR
jgi:hypothetical protein